jgi:hypothetical protein
MLTKGASLVIPSNGSSMGNVRRVKYTVVANQRYECLFVHGHNKAKINQGWQGSGNHMVREMVAYQVNFA